VESLLRLGFRNLRCLVRPSSTPAKLEALVRLCRQNGHLDVIRGDLLSREDCHKAVQDIRVIYHLAAARGEKSVAEAFLNSVVTTRNLLDAALAGKCLRRFVNLSSFSVYTNKGKSKGKLLDETCPMEAHPEHRGDAYSFAKVKQDEIVMEYGRNFGIPYVIVRPGVVYGPGNEAIHGRVGIGTFGIFLHLGGSNPIPLTYVENCADAIVLAGLKPGVEGEVFNVVDDDLPSSRRFLSLYKSNVRRFKSLYVPHALSYLMCRLWENYAVWSENQLPPIYNQLVWHAYWKKAQYSNAKVKSRLGWSPRVSFSEALRRHFESCKRKVYCA
jgi:nucleoside-diphosphate-sugar epimerase